MENVKVPTVEELEQYLHEYGWSYKKLNPNGDKEILVAPFNVDDQKGIYISFRIEGEFVMVSTVDFMMSVPKEELSKLFVLSDKLKLVKLFSVSEDPLNLDLGFELWAESINIDTFFAFMDMLCLGIESLLDKQKNQEITFTTKWVNFTK